MNSTEKPEFQRRFLPDAVLGKVKVLSAARRHSTP